MTYPPIRCPGVGKESEEGEDEETDAIQAEGDVLRIRTPRVHVEVSLMRTVRRQVEGMLRPLCCMHGLRDGGMGWNVRT